MSQAEHQNGEQPERALTADAPNQPADHMAPAEHAAGSSSNGDGSADDYGADKIKVLEGLEAVRKRPAMYIGSTGPPGCITSSTRSSTTRSTRRWPATATRSTSRCTSTSPSPSSTTAAASRSIAHASGRSAAEVVLTVLHAGGKFDNDSYKVSGGLHGVGVSVVNALSETLELEIWRNGQVYQQSYERGAPDRPASRSPAPPKKRGTKVTFKPDAQIFETTEFSFDTLAQRLRELAFLNGGVTITLDDERDGKSSQVPLRGRDRLLRRAPEPEQGEWSTTSRSTCTARRTASTSRSRCSGTTATPRRCISFANNINTHEGGTHLSGFRSALTRTINVLRRQEQPGEGPQGRQHQRRRHPRGADGRHLASRSRSRSSRGRRRRSWATPRSRASSRRSSTTSSGPYPRGEPRRRQAGRR